VDTNSLLHGGVLGWHFICEDVFVKLIHFYRGEIPNNEGVWLKDIMAYKYGQFECDHAWIQWVFPTKEPSNFNVDAPLLTNDEIILFQSDPVLKEKVFAAILKVLDFYGMEIHDEAVRWQEIETHESPQWWLESFNHNFLRITRILTSMRYLGYAELSSKTRPTDSGARRL
jgi:hypothetical protein